MFYYIILLDLLTRSPFYFVVRCQPDVVYKCFTPAAAESVRMFKVVLCLNLCIATRNFSTTTILGCSLTLEVADGKEPGA